MKRTTKYVGLDVHQAMTVATVRSEGGRVIARSVVETSDASIREFFSAMAGSVHVVFEEGTQAQWLYDLLSPRVDRVIVCDRRGEKRSGNKGDQVDADELSEQLRCGGLRAVYHGAHGRADLKELTRAYRNLVEDSTRVMLRLKALFRARAIRTTGSGVYQPKGRAAWVAIGRPGPFQDFYHRMIERGMREELARVTLARKLAALTLRLLKTGEVFDPTQLSRPQI